MRFEKYLTEALDKPYRFDFFSRNTEFGDSDSFERGKHGYNADFKTENGEKYNVFAFRLGWTKEERERNDQLEKERQARVEADAKAGKRKRIRMSKPLTGGIWEVHFNRMFFNKLKQKEDEDNSISGTGDAFRVFATIMEFIKEVISDKSPTYIALIAKTDDGSRAKLYETLAKRFSSKLGYEYVKTVKGVDRTRIEVKKK